MKPATRKRLRDAIAAVIGQRGSSSVVTATLNAISELYPSEEKIEKLLAAMFRDPNVPVWDGPGAFTAWVHRAVYPHGMMEHPKGSWRIHPKNGERFNFHFRDAGGTRRTFWQHGRYHEGGTLLPNQPTLSDHHLEGGRSGADRIVSALTRKIAPD